MTNKLLMEIVAILMVGLSLSAQGQDIVIPGESAKPARSDAPAAKPSSMVGMTFMDSKLFDARLAKELESGVAVVNIAIGGRIPLTNIPPRMDRWLVKCAETGTVEFLPIEQLPQTRFVFAMISLAFSAMPFLRDMREEQMYDKIQGYDAKIYYRRVEGGDSIIDRMILSKRVSKPPPR